MNKIGIFGGTFNPIHNGHLHLAEEMISRLALDRLLLVPVWSPPHKRAEELPAGETRLEMCRLACEGRGNIEVSDIELRRGGKSYTVDTLQALKEQYPEDTLYLITGSDMFLTLHEWRGFKTIARLAVLCTAARHEGEHERLERYAQQIGASYGAVCAVKDIPVKDISSTHIRRLLEQGVRPQGLLPDAVCDYISAHGLYRRRHS